MSSIKVATKFLLGFAMCQLIISIIYCSEPAGLHIVPAWEKGNNLEHTINIPNIAHWNFKAISALVDPV